MTTYGQFCPVAKAMEVLDERWTLLVVRELLAGSTRFNELRRGVPKMSPALLAKRLRSPGARRRGAALRGGRPSWRTCSHQRARSSRPLVEGLGSGARAGSAGSARLTWTRTCSCGTCAARCL